MKTIGLLGGMSWESTITYYKIINTVIKEQKGGLHSAKCLLYSVDFQEIEECQTSGNWQKSAQILTDAAKRLQTAGADFIVICTNTMHKVADSIKAGISIPILHIADVTAEALKKDAVQKTALLGTKYTMEQDFYKARLLGSGVNVIIPNKVDRELINSIIYNELCLGIISDDSRQKLLTILERLAARGAQAAILGCTEIGLLIRQQDTPIPLYDTTLLHASQAALSSI
jgi:aspartate racemase